MAILRAGDISKMSMKEAEEKTNELRIELIKSLAGKKTGGKSNAKEIKRTIARLLTFKNKPKTGGKTE